MKLSVRPAILEAAIELFGRYSQNGVTTRQLAKEAGVVEASIYNVFGSKDAVYLEAVTSVINQAQQEFAKFVVAEFGKSQTFSARRLENALKTWCLSLSRPTARLLMQVMLSDDRLIKTAREPIEQMIDMIANSVDRQKKPSRKFNSRVAARTLIRALIWARVEKSNATEVAQDVIETLQQWLLSLDAD